MFNRFLEAAKLTYSQVGLLMVLSIPMILMVTDKALSIVGMALPVEVFGIAAVMAILFNVVMIPIVFVYFRLTNHIYDKGVTYQQLLQEQQDEHARFEDSRG